MRDEPRPNAPLDDAIDAVLRDMVAREAPPMLKARVLARLGDETIDIALQSIAAREVPSTLRPRVMARLDGEPTRTDRAREERRTVLRPVLRPRFGLAAAGLVAALVLTVWSLTTPSIPTPGSERAGRVATRLDGSDGKPGPGAHSPAQSKGEPGGGGSLPSGAVTSTVATGAARLTGPPRTTRLARHTTTWPGPQSEGAASDADDPLAIRQLRVEPLSVSTIAIPPIEVAPVEIVPPMSDTAPGPSAEPGTESRTGG